MYNVIGTKNGVSGFILVITPNGEVPETYRTIEQAKKAIAYWTTLDTESNFVIVPAQAETPKGKAR